MTGREFLDGIRNLSVLVVGDVCLDRWCHYDPSLSEPSRETGIPRLAVTRTELTPGAAGTVANNLKSLGVRDVAVLGIVGEDGFGFELVQAFRAREIMPDFLIQHEGIPTFTYTKLINSQTDIEDQPRVDFVYVQDMPEEIETLVCEKLQQHAKDFDLICVSDQAETERGGVVTEAVRECLEKISEEQGKLVWVDSRARMEKFRKVVLKVNEQEASEALERTGSSSLREIQRVTNAPSVFVTHGGKGVKIATAEEENWIETKKVASPVDICGAGDSFTAGAACALTLGASKEAAVNIGHCVASVTIMKKGTGFALPEELIESEQRLRT